MRITIEIGDQLLRELELVAERQGTSLDVVLDDALRAHLGAERRDPGGYRLVWKTERGRVREGVNLEDRNALFDLGTAPD